MAKRAGLLLINLGTPNSPEPQDVGRYLSEFLMDKYVIGLPWFLRWILVNLLIVPRRKFASAHVYKTVWTDQGSPLLFHLESLADEVRKKAGDRYEIEIGMRYGDPSIERAICKFAEKDLDEIIAFPLYPQFSDATARSSFEACVRAAKKVGVSDRLRIVGPFFAHRGYISPYARRIKKVWDEDRPEMVLMSFHSLPETQIRRNDLSGGRYCLQSGACCDVLNEFNKNCYRAHCFATARALAAEVGLSSEQYAVSFQSRFGRAKWVEPFTEDKIIEIANRGVKRLAVVCPAFVADCVETLEEIGVRGRETFLSAGGEAFHLIPCLNSDPDWVSGVVEIAQAHARKPECVL